MPENPTLVGRSTSRTKRPPYDDRQMLQIPPDADRSTRDTLCIEDLNIKGLARTKLAKSFSDAALGSFVRMLDYKAEWHYRQVVRVSRWFPSSKTCFACGCIQQIELSDRQWTCSACGTRHDRDVNAARNILAEGLRLLTAGSAESQNAAEVYVRLATASSTR